MARPKKEGLEYFPLDVDIFDDPKLLFIQDKFESKGELIAIKLLCWIYRNGYYCEWNEEVALIFAKKNFSNIKAGLCDEVVVELVKRGFFNESIFDEFGVLTSRGIQSRWEAATKQSKRKANIKKEFNLLNDEILSQNEEETPSNEEETPSNGEETPSNEEESTQSKVNKSKVNKSKVKETILESEFELFWKLYDKNVGKARAKSEFFKLSETNRRKAMTYVPDYIKQRPEKQYRKHAENYLIEKIWEK